MGNSFDFVRKLVEAERYRDYKKEYWSGADVIITTPEKLGEVDSINGVNRTLRERLALDYPNIRIAETEYARGVIWLVNTLAPYVDYDYLSKYDYFEKIADCVDSYKENVKKQKIENEKVLLLEIIQDLEKEKKWEKTIYGDQMDRINWKEWYYFGVEHNDPFFVKFMTLWVAFNQKYNSCAVIKNRHYDERATIIKFCKKKINYLKSKYAEVFNKSRLVEEFCGKNSNGDFYIQDMQMHGSTSFLRKTNGIDNIEKRKEDCEKLKSDNEEEATLALFNSLYNVRCNLFHGGKDTSNSRDVELVRCAGEILEIYLKDLH